jgi:hypothetical protein
MTRYEYIALEFGFGDLSALNRYSNDGWKVVSVQPQFKCLAFYAMLEREVK